MKKRPYDVVLFGATGFTGALTAEYLALHADAGTRWALAGRNREKLDRVRDRLVELNPACAATELLVADVNDADAVRAVVEATKVVITTVGPYILHGEPLVAACAAAGTDYVDLTGEPEFVDLMWLRYHDQAVSSGARLVHSCGFDSIPHDLGAYFAVQQLPADQPIKLEGFVRAGGRFSGGTFASALNAFARVREGRQVAQQRRKRERGPAARSVRALPPRPRYDRDLKTWVLPMPTIDPVVVRRSARALGRYGPDFSYGHYVQVKSLPKVVGLAGGVVALFAAAQLKPMRNFLMARLPSGAGPTAEQRAKGWFRVRMRGAGGSQTVTCDVKGGDPGYGETAKMLAEAALCLAHDKLPKTAGQVTPAVAMGNHLIERLKRRGITFEVVG